MHFICLSVWEISSTTGRTHWVENKITIFHVNKRLHQVAQSAWVTDTSEWNFKISNGKFKLSSLSYASLNFHVSCRWAAALEFLVLMGKRWRKVRRGSKFQRIFLFYFLKRICNIHGEGEKGKGKWWRELVDKLNAFNVCRFRTHFLTSLIVNFNLTWLYNFQLNLFPLCRCCEERNEFEWNSTSFPA